MKIKMATQADSVVQENLIAAVAVDIKDPVTSTTVEHDKADDAKHDTVAMEKQNGQEKSREQLQEDVTVLKKKLMETEEMVKKTQSNLRLQQTRTKQLISIWKTHVERNEQNLKRQGMQRDQQLGEVISQLLFFEGQLRKEQKRIVSLLAEKDSIIQQQEVQIQELALTNSKLMQAFGDVKALRNKNGIVSAHDSSSVIGPKSPAPLEMSPPSDLTSKVTAKDKSVHKPVSRFTAVKNRLRRHKSNLELRNIENTIFEETAEELSSSQENVVCRRSNPRRTGRERCKSIAGYPVAADSGLDGETCDLQSGVENLYRGGFDRGLEDRALRGQFQPFENVDYSRELYDGFKENFQEVNPSTSPPNSNMLSVDDTAIDQGHKKMSLMDRIRSVSSSDVRVSAGSQESLKSDSSDSQKSPQAEGKSSPVSESNPFKTFKSMLKRKGSKLRKKRSVSLPQTTNMEYHEALKHHLDKEKTKK
ncbi:uncharacterized protein LOC135480084 [Liolophura sinensis]|uniref:uncharacterized protein LOC135480084 n=1 Tax=Liolophura sinensis TaxID=3198878 RepID=UPI00315811BE